MITVRFTEKTKRALREISQAVHPLVAGVLISKAGKLKDIVRGPNGEVIVLTYPRPEWIADVMWFGPDRTNCESNRHEVDGVLYVLDSHGMRESGLVVFDALGSEVGS